MRVSDSESQVTHMPRVSNEGEDEFIRRTFNKPEANSLNLNPFRHTILEGS